jgi:hypothetical protein
VDRLKNNTLAPWVVLLIVLIAATALLRVQGRLWVCSCNYVLIWAGDINSPDNSQHLFDAYTFTHILHGFIFTGLAYLLLRATSFTWKFSSALILEAVWEVIENSNAIIERYRAATISLGYMGDTLLNSFGDLLACALGAVIARYLGFAKTIALGVGIELLLLFFVRDNLILNIIMLLFPSDAIRQWQLGQ